MTTKKLHENIQVSEKGVGCLMCLQEHLGDIWTIYDRGTWYCGEHRKVLRDRWKERERNDEYRRWAEACNQN